MTGIMKNLEPYEFFSNEEVVIVGNDKVWSAPELDRTPINELGRKAPYMTVEKFPEEKTYGPFEHWLLKNKDKIRIFYKGGDKAEGLRATDISFEGSYIRIDIGWTGNGRVPFLDMDTRFDDTKPFFDFSNYPMGT